MLELGDRGNSLVNRPLLSPRKQFMFVIGVVLILQIAFAARMTDITARSLWFDEAVEYLTASAPLSQLPQAIVLANYQPPLQSYLLHFWLKVSIEPIWLRFMSVSLSMLTVACLIKWARSCLSDRAAWLAGLLVALQPAEIYYAQDVGEYALLVCSLSLGLCFLCLAHKHGHWRYWIAWAGFTLASTLSHYGASLVVVPVAIVTFVENVWRRRKANVVRQIILSGVGAIVGAALIRNYISVQIKRTESLNAAPFVSLYREIVSFITAPSSTFSYGLIGWPISAIPKWVAVIVLISIGVGIVLAWRRLSHRLLSWLLVTYVVYWGVVRAGLYVGYGWRYSLIFTPLFVLVTADVLDGLWHGRTAWLGKALLVGILSVQIGALPQPSISRWIRGSSSWQMVEQMNKVFEYWQTYRREDEATFVYYGAVPAFRYYLQLYGVDSERGDNLQPFIECSAQQATRVCIENKLFFSPWIRSMPPVETISKMEEVMGGLPDRLWIVFSHVYGDEEQEMIRQLRNRYRVMRHYSEGCAAVYLLVSTDELSIRDSPP